MRDTAMRYPGARIGRAGIAALLVGHCAGMIDLVALPVWITTLVGSYGLDTQQAGTLPTLFLIGAVSSSIFYARRDVARQPRGIVPLGFLLASVLFCAIPFIAPFAGKAALHLLAGAAVGASLSLTHGTIGLTENPHRTFATAGFALAVFGITYLGVTPLVVARHGGAWFFWLTGGVMAVASIVSLLAFPAMQAVAAPPDMQDQPQVAWPRGVWFAMTGVCAMAMIQAMIFSFAAQLGTERGFGVGAVTAVLVALGFVNLLPGPVAAWLQGRVDARAVLLAGAAAQAAVAVVITHAASFVPYAMALAVLSAIMIFTHTFAFGALAKLDPSGRAVAATPAMLMTGAAIGPILGGTLAHQLGYPSLGIAALILGMAAAVCFLQLPRRNAAEGTVNEAQSPVH